MRLFIEPTETLLFRTGRPFDAGEIGYAQTMFPPTPETLQGALRAVIAARLAPNLPLSEVFLQRDIVDLIGNNKPENYGRFRISHLTLGRRESSGNVTLLYPAPSYILEEKQTKTRRRLMPTPAKRMEYVVDSNLPEGMQFLKLNDKSNSKLEPIKGWLTESSLQDALDPSADVAKIEIIRPDTIYSYETRVGIGMDNHVKKTEDGRLYQIQMVRMQPTYGFVVDTHFTQEGQKESQDVVEMMKRVEISTDKGRWGWITLGGEQRAASISILPDSTFPRKQTGKIHYLVTPAYFESGWQPPVRFTEGIRPIAAAISHYQRIGGWSLNPQSGGGSGKTMRRCVPAGSVYFFDREVAITQPMTEYGDKIGYGFTYAGDNKR